MGIMSNNKSNDETNERIRTLENKVNILETTFNLKNPINYLNLYSFECSFFEKFLAFKSSKAPKKLLMIFVKTHRCMESDILPVNSIIGLNGQ